MTAPAPERPAEIKLSKLEATALTAWQDCDDDYGFAFKAISTRSGVPLHLVRRVVRAMARKGVTKYCRCLWDDDGAISAGYMLTDAGRALITGATP